MNASLNNETVIATLDHTLMKTFFAMGGYGWYVWSSYACVLLSLIGYAWSTAYRSAQTRRWLKQSMTRAP